MSLEKLYSDNPTDRIQGSRNPIPPPRAFVGDSTNDTVRGKVLNLMAEHSTSRPTEIMEYLPDDPDELHRSMLAEEELREVISLIDLPVTLLQ
jgi:hypothetical protein